MGHYKSGVQPDRFEIRISHQKFWWQ